ncbi:hypothetical protein FNV43_RR14605 [Rhamnella rubrinervis]|uniref:Scarecrow-like protein 3 n=1 Tax=Rhamnella rubrinervis TaxID=2594499 RepID=A0A8K0H387_9ROSA|nr:hypothetical protein FNV43_RR14605 [Rhamnella rubrinervis]
MNSSSSPTSFNIPDVTLSLTPSSALTTSTPPQGLEPEERGIYLIQNLITCAKHAASGDLHHADSCLRQISKFASVDGDSLQRLAARFASALALRLVKRWPGLYKALSCTQRPNPEPDRARQVFSRAFPYLGFAYAIIARTLLQSMSHDGAIHIVDLGSGDSKLWVPLMRSFALVPRAPPHLRITCVHGDKTALEKLGQRLVKEAKALHMPFQYNPVNVMDLVELNIDMLKLKPGEALGFVSVLNLHVLLAEDDQVDAHFGVNKKDETVIKECKKMGNFLATIRSTSPKVVLLVEQEADHNLNRLVDRLVGSLNYYSAVFDSLDATFGSSSSSSYSSEDRLEIEEMFGREIENIMACEGLERVERHETYARWVVRLGGGGFKPVRLWFHGSEDCKKMVEAYGKQSYKIACDKATFFICWHQRPLYAVSAWTC